MARSDRQYPNNRVLEQYLFCFSGDCVPGANQAAYSNSIWVGTRVKLRSMSRRRVGRSHQCNDSQVLIAQLIAMLNSAHDTHSTTNLKIFVVDWGITGNWTVGGSLRLMTNDSEASDEEP
eukprot:g59011.t1